MRPGPPITTRHRASRCGHCSAELTASTGPHGARPKPGDLTVCYYCGAIHQYGQGLELIQRSEADLEAMEGLEPETLRTLRLLAAAVAHRVQ